MHQPPGPHSRQSTSSTSSWRCCSRVEREDAENTCNQDCTAPPQPNQVRAEGKKLSYDAIATQVYISKGPILTEVNQPRDPWDGFAMQPVDAQAGFIISLGSTPLFLFSVSPISKVELDTL